MQPSSSTATWSNSPSTSVNSNRLSPQPTQWAVLSSLIHTCHHLPLNPCHLFLHPCFLHPQVIHHSRQQLQHVLCQLFPLHLHLMYAQQLHLYSSLKLGLNLVPLQLWGQQIEPTHTLTGVSQSVCVVQPLQAALGRLQMNPMSQMLEDIETFQRGWGWPSESSGHYCWKTGKRGHFKWPRSRCCIQISQVLVNYSFNFCFLCFFFLSFVTLLSSPVVIYLVNYIYCSAQSFALEFDYASDLEHELHGL